MPDRNALANALMSATPEQLRDAAEWALMRAGHPDAKGYDAEPMQILAALALAVAEMQEQGVAYFREDAQVWWGVSGSGQVANFASSSGIGDGDHPSLPAALAALVGERT